MEPSGGSDMDRAGKTLIVKFWISKEALANVGEATKDTTKQRNSVAMNESSKKHLERSFKKMKTRHPESLNYPVQNETPEELAEQMDIDARAKESYKVGADGIPAMPLDWRKGNILWPFQDISDKDKDLWKDLPNHCTDAEPNTTTYALAGFFASASRRKLDQALVDEVRRMIRESKWMRSRKHEDLDTLVGYLQMEAVQALIKRVKELEGYRTALTSEPSRGGTKK